MNQYILPFKAGQKILEIGGGENPVLRPNLDFRKMPTVDIVHDLEQFPYPIADGEYEGVFAKFVIEHITWRKVADFVKELHRIIKPGGLAVLISPNTFEQCAEIVRRGKIEIEENALLYGGQEGTWEATGNYHKAAFSPEYATKLFREAGFSEVKIEPLPGCHTDMIIIALQGQEEASKISKNSNLPIKLNIGSFTVMLLANEGWCNLDILDLKEWAKQRGFNFWQCDVRKGLPYSDNYVDFINASHLIEHLTIEEGIAFLKECKRVLKEGCSVRIGYPDLAKLVSLYRDVAMATLYRSVSLSNPAQTKEYLDMTEAGKFWSVLTSDHKTAYDIPALRESFMIAGFVEIRESEYDKTTDMFPEHSRYITAKKPPKAAKSESPHGQLGGGTLRNPFEIPSQKLKIALISTPFLRTPPDQYGGLELIVANLGQSLAALGHDVTIFAANGSKVPGCKIFECGEPALKVQVDWHKMERDAYNAFKDHLKDFDIVHGHNWFGFEYLAKMASPKLKVTHTHHGGMSWASKPVEKMNLHGISKFMAQYYGQVLGLPEVRFVYNGIDTNMYKFQRVKGDRLIYVGRISKFKQPHVAIEVARRLNLGLDIVGGTFVDDFAYLNQIKNMCDGTQIKFHPDASHDLKIRLLGDAKCLLFPSAMGEPFGLVAVEAGSCGTPVVALRDGAIPELVLDGINGYVCSNVEEMVSAVGRVHAIKPENCRQVVEQNFTRQLMAERYLKNYRDIIDGKEW